MSINSALNTSVGGLRAQSARIASVSENIANSSTIAYKTSDINFRSLVVGGGKSASGGYSSGGVLYNPFQNINTQGLIQATGLSTNIALNGNGFFVVTDDTNNQPSGYTYTRNGNFKTDASGLLINSEGYYLLGQRTDDTGRVIATNTNDLNSLEPIDVNTISGVAQATTEVRFDMNLPADAVAGDNFTNSFEIFDSLGVSHTISATWLKNSANNWTVTYSDPVQTNTGVTSGALDTGGAGPADHSVTIQFDGNGAIQSFTPAVPQFTVTGFTSGATDSTVALDLGTVGLTDGVTQFSSNTVTPDLEIFLIDQDGTRFGQLSGITINDSGLVEASFENGVRRPIFQLPVATFPNPAGLINVNGTVYDEAEAAGNLNLRSPGEGNAGTIIATALEMSTTDTSEEFNKMIVSQQAYSAGAQVISTADEMFQELIGAVR
jgi:flagellar hook protein FlgE